MARSFPNASLPSDKLPIVNSFVGVCTHTLTAVHIREILSIPASGYQRSIYENMIDLVEMAK